MSTSWRHYSPDNFKAQSTRKQKSPISSTPDSSTSAAQISSNASLQHLCADVKAILQSVEASLREQKKISKDLNDLGTTVNVLEGVICGNVGGRKRAENMNLDTVQSEGGIVRRLATMDGAINDLLARVSTLDTASLCCDANTTSPPLQKEYLDTSTSTDEPLTPVAPPSCRLKFPPWFPSQHSPKTLTPASWNSNRMYLAS
ncbi:hypothetical protein CY34DRAFT_658696 [Suillus luteus UH-Slu-Lm8-n1]|uniref:Uncharacterized protein n=1 Tax=Suillus luteus UH-Slu-Lm8-n1 TaxID=930992 RepID=A0A0D0AIN1_9AGAM|nr:hypothetical protein CY34DRAFT_658696 [Suillus luteus UH-Slu-Lm8-n1]